MPFEQPSLGDVYEAALQKGRNATVQLMRDLLSVDPSGLDEGYRLWFSLPWYRIYTVNIDDLPLAAERAFDLPRRLQVLSALQDTVPAPEAERLQVIHLNGSLEDLPEVTFSSRQYGQRQNALDLWMAGLAIDLQTHPVLYVGTSLNEPPLWSYVEARGSKRTKRETRPGSFLVSPHLDRAKEVALSLYNVSWVTSTAANFASEVLSALATEASEGLKAIKRRAQVEREGPPALRISEVEDDSRGDEREFLMGREPRWSDLTHGYAVERTCDAEIAAAFEEESVRLLVITGTAGSGKSTAAMRLALEQAALGPDVYTLNPDTAESLGEIRRSIRNTKMDLLLVDNAERFGKGAVPFVKEILEDSPELRVVVCLRGSYMRTLDEFRDSQIDMREYAVPLLGPDDTEALLDALDEANRLGELKGLTRRQQREAMERTFGRQLLVALLEVTQGVRFEEKIESECRELEGEAPLLYAIAALATYAGAPLSENQLVTAVGDAAKATEEIQRMISRNVLIHVSQERISVRHAVIAERVVRYYQSKEIIAQVFTALITGLASTIRVGEELRKSRAGRLLIRLINHEFITRHVYQGDDTTANLEAVRSIYDAVEPLLRSDYHYWLQRGSFETKEDPGDLGLASNYLEQARSMAGDDFNVRTQWSYMMLKRASRQAGAAGEAEDVQTAFGELEEVIEKRGSRDSYPFHVYGSQGLAWVHRAPLPFEEKKQLLERLREVVTSGLNLHRGNRELKKLKEDLDHDYMSLAVRD